MNAITTTATTTFKNVRGTDRSGAERQLDSPRPQQQQQQQQHFVACTVGPQSLSGRRRSTQIESRLYWYQDLAWLLQA